MLLEHFQAGVGLGHDPAKHDAEIGRVIEPRTRIMDNTKYIDQHMTCS